MSRKKFKIPFLRKSLENDLEQFWSMKNDFIHPKRRSGLLQYHYDTWREDCRKLLFSPQDLFFITKKLKKKLNFRLCKDVYGGSESFIGLMNSFNWIFSSVEMWFWTFTRINKMNEMKSTQFFFQGGTYSQTWCKYSEVIFILKKSKLEILLTHTFFQVIVFEYETFNISSLYETEVRFCCLNYKGFLKLW